MQTLFNRSDHFETSYLIPCQECCCHTGHQILKAKTLGIRTERGQDMPSPPPSDTTLTAAGTREAPRYAVPIWKPGSLHLTGLVAEAASVTGGRAHRTAAFISQP